MRSKPTPRLAGLLALGFAALLLAPLWSGVVVVVLAWDVVLLVLFLAEARRLRRGLRLDVERELGARFSLGTWNPVTLRVLSRTPFPLSLLLTDEPPRSFDLEPGEERLGLPAHGQGTAAYALRPHARGLYRFGALRIEAAGMLGLAAVVQTAAEPSEVKVYPDLRALRRLALGSRYRDLSAMGLRVQAHSGAGDEFDQLRDYLPDDDYRDINWKATAKRRKPVTQVYQTERSQRVLIALDCGRSMAARTGDLTKLDLAVNAALVLAHVALRLGDLVGLTVFSTEVETLVPPKKGPRHFARILEALYAVRAELTFVDYKALAREIVARRLRRGLVVIFTDLLDEASSRPLVEAARLLSRKHAVLIVAPSDPVVAAAARAPARTAEDVFRALAAREALAERRSVMESVRRLGVEVIDSAAGEMAVRGINHYLDRKRRRGI